MNVLQDAALVRADAMKRIEEAVGEAEKRTTCEFVVAVAPASMRYDREVFAAALVAGSLLYFGLYLVEWLAWGTPSNPMALLADGMLVGLLAGWMVRRSARLTRKLSGEARRTTAVDRAFGSVFFEQKVSFSPARNAILLYVSVLEGQARLFADVGVTSKIPEAVFGEILGDLVNAREGSGVERVCEAVARMGDICAEAFPLGEGEEHELPDRPVLWLP